MVFALKEARNETERENDEKELESGGQLSEYCLASNQICSAVKTDGVHEADNGIVAASEPIGVAVHGTCLSTYVYR
jgi:hypothetical protein